jgi:hypothetical protein
LSRSVRGQPFLQFDNTVVWLCPKAAIPTIWQECLSGSVRGQPFLQFGNTVCQYLRDGSNPKIWQLFFVWLCPIAAIPMVWQHCLSGSVRGQPFLQFGNTVRLDLLKSTSLLLVINLATQFVKICQRIQKNLLHKFGNTVCLDLSEGSRTRL